MLICQISPLPIHTYFLITFQYADINKKYYWQMWAKLTIIHGKAK